MRAARTSMRIAVGSSFVSASSESEIDGVGPELGVVRHRGERVAHAHGRRLVRDGALEHGERFVLLPAVEQRFTDDAGEVRGRRRRTQLHLAELRDHFEATDLRVDFARARQRLQVVGEELPRALIETERTLALGDHILDERSELEEPFGLFGLRAQTLRFLLELIDCGGPVTRLA